MILTGENRNILSKTCPSATLSTTNFMSPDVVSNPGLCVEKPRLNASKEENQPSTELTASGDLHEISSRRPSLY